MSGGAHGGNEYAWGDGYLSRLDPRVKIIAVVAMLVINLLSGVFLTPLAISVSMLALMFAGRIPYRRQLLMIAFPSMFAVFIVVSQTLFEGTGTFASIGWMDLHRDGLIHGLFLALRVLAGGLVVVVLGVTTPVNRLCLALGWFRVPATFLEVLQLTYRYLYDIHAEYGRMREAQRVRLGWSSARTGLASSHMLGGSLFMRVYERGQRSSEAMSCRGAGAVVKGTLPRPGRTDVWGALAALSLIAALLAISWGPRP